MATFSTSFIRAVELAIAKVSVDSKPWQSLRRRIRASCVVLSMTENTDTFDRERWVRRQSALAEFGRQALIVDDLDALLHEAVVLAAQGLGIDRAKVMEALPDRDKLLMRAGTGWKPDLVGNLVVD